MKWSITSQVGTVTVVTFILVGFFGHNFYKRTLEQIEASRLVARTHQVVAQLEAIHGAIKGMESSQNGYAITGSKSSLKSYREHVQHIRLGVPELRQLTYDNQRQQERITRLEGQLAKRIEYAQRLINLKDSAAPTMPISSIVLESEETTKHIDQIITEIKAEEYELLSLRNKTFEEKSNYDLRDIAISIFVSLSTLVATFLLVGHYETVRRRAEENLRAIGLKFEGIFNNALEPIVLLSPNGSVVQANDSSHYLMGKSKIDLLGLLSWETTWWQKLPEEQRKLQESVKKAAQGETVRWTFQTVDHTGKSIDMEFSLKPLKDERSRIIYLLLEGHDVSDIKRTERALKESEGRLSAIFGSMVEGLYQLDKQGNLVYLNKAGAAILGYELDEIKGSNMHGLIHKSLPDGTQRPASDCPLLKVISQGTIYKTPDDVFIKRDGTYLPVKISSSPLIIDNKVDGAVILFEDITALKKAQERAMVQYTVTRALVQSETVEDATAKTLESVCQNAGWDLGALWLYNNESECLKLVKQWNSPSLNVLANKIEFEKSVVLDAQKSSLANVYLENAPLWLECKASEESDHVLIAAANCGMHTSLTFPIRNEDKTIGVIGLYKSELSDPDLEILILLDGLGRQFGQFIERKKVNTRLRESEEILRQLADNIKEVCWIISPKADKCFYISPAYEKLWGLSREKLYESILTFMEVVHPDDRIKVRNHLRLKNLVPNGGEIEARLLLPNGELRWVWARSSPVFDEHRHVVRICGIIHDITERKEMEKRVSEFYSTVSHELRTPLTSIRGALGLIEGGLAGQLSFKAQQLVKIGRNESDRLIRLINDILDIKKIEAGKLELRKEAVLPKQLVELTFNVMENIADEAKVQLVSDIHVEDPISCDRDRTVQVLTNLISNAIKFSPTGAEVKVVVKQNGPWIRFSVIDQGAGIQETQKHKLFGLFQQLDLSASRQKGGTGLGLAISKAIVEQHGGHIGVDTKNDAGSVFWFEFPVSSPVVFLSPKDEILDVPHQILLIEDDMHLAERIRDMLTRNGYQLTIASSVSEAEKSISGNTPEAIILDIPLPDGSGLDWMNRRREERRTEEIPFIVLTEANINEIGNEQASPIDCLRKPFDEKHLLKALAKAVGINSNGQAKVLIVDDDKISRELVKGQLNNLGLSFIEASSGKQAIKLALQEKPDLIILELGVPYPDGFGIVKALRNNETGATPLIVYTSHDMTHRDMQELTLGLTRHLTKSRTPATKFVEAVRELLGKLALSSHISH